MFGIPYTLDTTESIYSTFICTKFFELYNSDLSITMEQLKEYIVCFSVVNFPREKDFLIQDLKRKINFYTTKQKELEKIKLEEQKKELEKEKEDLELQIYKKNKILIELFIKSNYENKYDFCNSNFIDIKDFENIVEYCKKYDKDTYNQYEAAIAEQRQKKFNKKLSLTKTLIYYLQNGIKNENVEVKKAYINEYGKIVLECKNLKDFKLNTFLEYKVRIDDVFSN